VVGKNVSFANNIGQYGGAIYLLIKCQLTLTQYSGYYNTATLQGGFLKVLGAVSISLTSGILSNQDAQFGGALHLSSNGVTATIKDTELSHNSCDEVGGAIVAEDGAVVNIENCMLSYNSAKKGGVAYIRSSNFKVTDSFLVFNTAKQGGAINAEEGTITITQSLMTSNTATVSDGGVFNIIDSTVLNVIECRLNVNNAENGGILYMSDLCTATIISSNFSRNSAFSDGGIIFGEKSGSLFIHDSLFFNNTAQSGSIAYNMQDATIGIHDCHFENNVGQDFYGGGGFDLFQPSTVIFNNTKFKSGIGGVGAAIRIDGDYDTTTSTSSSSRSQYREEILDNSFISTSTVEYISSNMKEYRSLSDDEDYDILITNCAFEMNKRKIEHLGSEYETCLTYPDENGGAIALINLGSRAKIEYSHFERNIACTGAGIYVDYGDVTVNSCEFRNNIAVIAGGGIYWNYNAISQVKIYNQTGGGNQALYGPMKASSQYMLYVSPHSNLENSGATFEEPIVVIIKVK
jgi:hypothetical protein